MICVSLKGRTHLFPRQQNNIHSGEDVEIGLSTAKQSCGCQDSLSETWLGSKSVSLLAETEKETLGKLCDTLAPYWKHL